MPGQFVPSPKNLMLRRGGSRVPRTGREESGPLSDPRRIEVRAMYKTPSFLQAKGGSDRSPSSERGQSLGSSAGRCSGARWTHPDDSAGDCGSLGSRQGPQATRKQAMDLQAANLAALRRRDGQTVVSEGAPARWRLKEGRQPHTSLAFGGRFALGRLSGRGFWRFRRRRVRHRPRLSEHVPARSGPSRKATKENYRQEERSSE
jgi:hypothetical protein